jgi:hypothetical protein
MHSVVTFVCSEDTCIDASVIACVRRLQKWSMTSIIAEFRYLTGRKDFDMEQFIEFFDVNDAVRVSRRRMPAYIDVYLRMEVWVDDTTEGVWFHLLCIYRRKS